MRSRDIVLAVGLSLGVASLAWCADEPTPAPTATPAPVAQPASAQETPAASSAEAAKAAATAKKAAPDAEEKSLRSRGYSKEIHNGQTLYCRREAALGTRFETKQCGTAESINLAAQQGKDQLEYAKRANGTSSH